MEWATLQMSSVLSDLQSCHDQHHLLAPTSGHRFFCEGWHLDHPLLTPQPLNPRALSSPMGSSLSLSSVCYAPCCLNCLLSRPWDPPQLRNLSVLAAHRPQCLHAPVDHPWQNLPVNCSIGKGPWLYREGRRYHPQHLLLLRVCHYFSWRMLACIALFNVSIDAVNGCTSCPQCCPDN